MTEFWDKISYMVQILAACLVYMLPVRRREKFVLRFALWSLVLLAASWLLNTFYTTPLEEGAPLLYWASYIIFGIFFVWRVLGCSLLQALYCAISSCGMQHITFDVFRVYTILGGKNPFISFFIYVVVYVLFYILFARKLPQKGEFVVNRESLFPITTMIILVWVLSILEMSSLSGFESGVFHSILYRIIDGLCCFYVLWVQINQKEKLGLQRELDGINSAWRQQKKQYEVTSETIDSINRKCHDLKHQIGILRETTDEQEKAAYLDEIEQDIMIYDTALKTGNKALDTVLMEKGLFCKNHGIQWSCMADGGRLEFMKLEDIYAIFGNALDNAIAAVQVLKNEEQKVISVKIITQNNILVIQIQNYYDSGLHFENGLPVTTRKNKRDHGYGMKSIQYTAEKYNGTITVQAKNHIFMLQILIPVGGE